jgi:transposase
VAHGSASAANTSKKSATIALDKEGLSCREISARVGCGWSSMPRLLERKHEIGEKTWNRTETGQYSRPGQSFETFVSLIVKQVHLT